MDEPIVSIYDMLTMRYRQQRKDEFKQQKDQDYDEHLNSVAQLKKPRSRVNHIRGPLGTKSTVKGPATVVTASHLTQKQQGIIIPQPTKKDVLNRLVTKMTANMDKQPVESEHLSQDPKESATQIRVGASKKRVAARTKARIIKSSRASVSSNLRTRLALSPRNTNALEKPAAKPAKSSSTIALEPKIRSRASTSDVQRSNVRLKTRKSKAAAQWNEKEPGPAKNVVRYRL